MSLVEAGYGNWHDVENMSPILRKSIIYARAEMQGGNINWENGTVSWPKSRES